MYGVRSIHQADPRGIPKSQLHGGLPDQERRLESAVARGFLPGRVIWLSREVSGGRKPQYPERGGEP